MTVKQIRTIIIFVHYLTFALLFSQTTLATEPEKAPENVTEKKSQPLKELAVIDTSMGTIKIELYRSKAPATVDNFVQYANNGYYNDTIFHRVIPNFMIQGGGFDQTFAQKPTNAPVKNEAKPFVPNSRGTIAMARTSDPDSATSQFFINVKNNRSLNRTQYSAGYAVFGKVVEGMAVADTISKVQTESRNYMQDVPAQNIIIKSIRIDTEMVEPEGKK